VGLSGFWGDIAALSLIWLRTILWLLLVRALLAYGVAVVANMHSTTHLLGGLAFRMCVEAAEIVVQKQFKLGLLERADDTSR
jgi:hypothetical protein